MITIITKQSTDFISHYDILYENLPMHQNNQLHIMITLITSDLLNEEVDGIVPEMFTNELQVLHGEERCGDNYYIGFFNRFLREDVEKMCEKKYGKREFILDNDTPMLKFSKENFEHILTTWNKIKDNMPAYIILTESDDNWIDIWPKESLTDNEKKLIQRYKTDPSLH